VKKGRPSKRGDVVAILNRMLRENRIAGFTTNLFERPAPEHPRVTVFNRMGDDPKAVEQEVCEALAAAGASIEVRVDPLNDLEG
jgi:hypothetical protein